MTDHTANREMQRLADALSAEWDAINRGGEHVSPGAAEPLIGAARRLHTVDTTPGLSRDRRDRIWRGIMAAHATGASPATALPQVDTATKALLDSRPSVAPGTPTDQSRRPFGTWIGTQLATAAILLLTLAVGYVAIGRPRLARDVERVPEIPALESTQAVNVPAAEAETVLLRATIETLPGLTSWVAMERTVLDPGMEITLGRGQDRGEGPLLLRVESGTLTLHADGAMQVTRSGSETASDVTSGTAVTLNTGDQGFAPSGVVTHWRNDAAAPVSVLDATIASYSSGWFTTPAGISYEELIGEYSYVPPDPPFELAVRRVTLQPGATLAVDATPGLEMLQVETGKLVALDPVPGKTATPFAFDAGTMENGNFRPGRIFRAADDQPVTMLVMTIIPAETATPPPT